MRRTNELPFKRTNALRLRRAGALLFVSLLTLSPFSNAAAMQGRGRAPRKTPMITNSKIATVLEQTHSPLVSFRILFNTGAASDPAGKEGVASLTAAMLSEGGS